MIRDSLAELIHANHVDILKKVRDCLFTGNCNNDSAKLINVLDLGMLRDVGTIINETVLCHEPGATI